MEPLAWNVVAVVMGAITGLVTALGTWSHQRGKLEVEARAAVGAAWQSLCSEQQERIAQMQEHLERVEARAERAELRADKAQNLAEQLRERVITLETENAELRIDLKAKDARISALERENNCLRGAK